MSELHETLERAFEDAGYDVVDVSENRDQVRIQLFDEDAAGEEVRRVLHDAVPEDDVMGVNASTEQIEGRGELATVVSFRHRPS